MTTIHPYAFDRLPSRADTGSLKWDRYGSDVLPMWVADMDLKLPEIIDALKRRLNHKVFGYTIPYESVTEEAVLEYLKRQHSYSVDKDCLNFFTRFSSSYKFMLSRLHCKKRFHPDRYPRLSTLSLCLKTQGGN